MSRRAIALRGLTPESAKPAPPRQRGTADLALWATARGWESWEIDVTLDGSAHVVLRDISGNQRNVLLTRFHEDPSSLPWAPVSIRTYEVGQARRKVKSLIDEFRDAVRQGE